MPPADRCSIRGLYFCWFRRHCLYVRCTIRHCAELFDATLHRLCVRCATRRYPEPFDATLALHCLCTALQMNSKLFVIELVHFTISCSNSTWVTGPFIIWLDYSCLGCSVSWWKTKPSIIWPCHSFISYSILQLILKPALYLLIYFTSLYFWRWRPPISGYICIWSAAGDQESTNHSARLLTESLGIYDWGVHRTKVILIELKEWSCGSTVLLF